eukprot:31271-Pelagococcus_subviridis.AAC.9
MPFVPWDHAAAAALQEDDARGRAAVRVPREIFLRRLRAADAVGGQPGRIRRRRLLLRVFQILPRRAPALSRRRAAAPRRKASAERRRHGPSKVLLQSVERGDARRLERAPRRVRAVREQRREDPAPRELGGFRAHVAVEHREAP